LRGAGGMLVGGRRNVTGLQGKSLETRNRILLGVLALLTHGRVGMEQWWEPVSVALIALHSLVDPQPGTVEEREACEELWARLR
jgi:hypothetical protein